jgi:hypothetical protein
MATQTQAEDMWRKSAECYLKAARQLPEDDEDHACEMSAVDSDLARVALIRIIGFLRCALQC